MNGPGWTCPPLEKAASLLLLAAALSCRNAPEPPPPAPSQKEVFPGLVTEGQWESSRPRARKGSRLSTTDPQARIRFTFAGERLVLFRRMAPGAGTVEVCVDDACRDVDNGAPRDFGKQPFHVSGLRSGDHTVRLSLRSGPGFDLDGVEAAGAPGDRKSVV